MSRKIIIDTDPGQDDAVAILLALASPELDVLGVTAVAGNVPLDLTSKNALRVIRREVLVGLLNGLVFAVIMGIIGVLWFGTPMLGVVIGVAMVVNLLVAGLAGILIPIVLQKVGVDPALASGAFVTTVTDVVGFFAFLGLAAILLL